jgi:hypothetical protein
MILRILVTAAAMCGFASGQRDRLAIADAGDVTDETAGLIHDAHLDGGYLVVVAYADGFGS